MEDNKMIYDSFLIYLNHKNEILIDTVNFVGNFIDTAI